jgi:hypothetical protein
MKRIGGNNMRMTLNGRLTLLIAHGIGMVGIGLALFYVRATMTNVIFDICGSIIVLMLVAASLLLSAMLDWVCAVGTGLHHVVGLRRYLFLSLISAGAGLFFVLYPAASIRPLCYFIAAYALFLGIGKLWLAQHWDGGKSLKLVLNVLGGIAVCFSGSLVAIADKEDRSAIALLALYSMFVGGQMLLTTFYLYRQKIALSGSASEQEQVHA